jgi:hypothetical protein
MQSPSLKKASSGLLGALAIAGGSSAYGAVVVVAPPSNIVPGSVPSSPITVNWDVNGDALNDFSFTFAQPQTSGAQDWIASVTPLTGNFVIATHGLVFFYAQRFTAGQTIPTDLPPGATLNPTSAILGSNFNGNSYGQFQARGFLGIQFKDSGNVSHYGYLELQVSRSTGGTPGIQFFSAAYDNGTLTPIIAGAVPEPGTLAMLAMGAAGVLAAHQRRRRKQADAK